MADEEFSIGYNELMLPVRYPDVWLKQSVKNRNLDLRGMVRDAERNLEILLLKLNSETK